MNRKRLDLSERRAWEAAAMTLRSWQQPDLVEHTGDSEHPEWVEAIFMDASSWFAGLEHVDTSYLLLAVLVATILCGGILYQIGLIGWVLRIFGLVVRGCIRKGFRLWERLLAWASWPQFLAIVFGFLLIGRMAAGPWPGSRILCGLIALFMGMIACLAYMFIDLERNEVERGHKAVYNPLKGQVLAMNK